MRVVGFGPMKTMLGAAVVAVGLFVVSPRASAQAYPLPLLGPTGPVTVPLPFCAP